MPSIFDVILFVFLIVGGIIAEALIQEIFFRKSRRKQRNYHFSWQKFGFLLLPIVCAVGLFVLKFGISILIVLGLVKIKADFSLNY